MDTLVDVPTTICGRLLVYRAPLGLLHVILSSLCHQNSPERYGIQQRNHLFINHEMAKHLRSATIYEPSRNSQLEGCRCIGQMHCSGIDKTADMNLLCSWEWSLTMMNRVAAPGSVEAKGFKKVLETELLTTCPSFPSCASKGAFSLLQVSIWLQKVL